MNLDEEAVMPRRKSVWYINNSQKDEGLRPHHDKSYGGGGTNWQKVYQAYPRSVRSRWSGGFRRATAARSA